MQLKKAEYQLNPLNSIRLLFVLVRRKVLGFMQPAPGVSQTTDQQVRLWLHGIETGKEDLYPPQF